MEDEKRPHSVDTEEDDLPYEELLPGPKMINKKIRTRSRPVWVRAWPALLEALGDSGSEEGSSDKGGSRGGGKGIRSGGASSGVTVAATVLGSAVATAAAGVNQGGLTSRRLWIYVGAQCCCCYCLDPFPQLWCVCVGGSWRTFELFLLQRSIGPSEVLQALGATREGHS